MNTVMNPDERILEGMNNTIQHHMEQMGKDTHNRNTIKFIIFGEVSRFPKPKGDRNYKIPRFYKSFVIDDDEQIKQTCEVFKCTDNPYNQPMNGSGNYFKVKLIGDDVSLCQSGIAMGPVPGYEAPMTTTTPRSESRPSGKPAGKPASGQFRKSSKPSTSRSSKYDFPQRPPPRSIFKISSNRRSNPGNSPVSTPPSTSVSQPVPQPYYEGQ